MATKTIVKMTDDTDGKPAVETVALGIDGTTYHIDLSEKNAAKLRKAFEPYVSAGRRTGGRKGRASTLVATDVDTAAVRKWAEANGIDISRRGRIAANIVQQYRAAGN